MIPWTGLKIFAHESFNDDLGLAFTFYGKVKFAFLAFILQELMELGEECFAKVINTIQ